MRPEVFDSCGTNSIAILACHDERCELHDARRAQAMRIQQGNDIGKDLVRLLCNRVRRRAVWIDAQLARQVDQFTSLGDDCGVAIQAKGWVYDRRIGKFCGHEIAMVWIEKEGVHEKLFASLTFEPIGRRRPDSRPPGRPKCTGPHQCGRHAAEPHR